jgi:hypothetical protein
MNWTDSGVHHALADAVAALPNLESPWSSIPLEVGQKRDITGHIWRDEPMNIGLFAGTAQPGRIFAFCSMDETLCLDGQNLTRHKRPQRIVSDLTFHDAATDRSVLRGRRSHKHLGPGCAGRMSRASSADQNCMGASSGG